MSTTTLQTVRRNRRAARIRELWATVAELEAQNDIDCMREAEDRRQEIDELEYWQRND